MRVVLPAKGTPKGMMIGNNASKGQNKGQGLANKRQLTCFPASKAIHEGGLASTRSSHQARKPMWPECA